MKMVVRLQSLGFCILHLNVTTTLDDMVLYSVSVKVGCFILLVVIFYGGYKSIVINVSINWICG